MAWPRFIFRSSKKSKAQPKAAEPIAQLGQLVNPKKIYDKGVQMVVNPPNPFEAQLVKRTARRIRSEATKVSGGLTPLKDSPDELLGELFQDVQLKRIHADGKTFVDLVPGARLGRVLKAYEHDRQKPNFDLHAFVEEHFKDYLLEATANYHTNPNNTIEQHINELWHVLRRQNHKSTGSLMPLPYEYVVPGGRFSEQFYWDSYFIMLGLAASDRYDLVEGMIKNYAYMIRKLGYIPTANRTYFTSRSQPPFFVHMVHLLAQKEGRAVYVKYLPYMLAEYRFWMKGTRSLDADHLARYRTVLMPDGSVLNRYHDNKRTPRPESYKEDVETAQQASDRIASRVYLDLRAGAESGWDFSSRWFADGKTLATIHVNDIAPIDLNCLLYQLEQTIADSYIVLKQNLLAKPYQQRAQERAATIQKYCWSPKEKFFVDFDFVAGKQSGGPTLAGMFAMYANIATPQQAAAMVERLSADFLQAGGLVATLVETGQQWDYPNGWAPLQWIAIRGLRNYGYNDLAEEVKKRWIATCKTLYEESGKLVEKYNVVTHGKAAGGGEYQLQDGFGWTNGVLLSLLAEDTRPPEAKK